MADLIHQAILSSVQRSEKLCCALISMLGMACAIAALKERSQLQNPALRTRPGIKQQMPAAGTSHCGSYKSPGPKELALINSSLKRDGEFVFFPPSSRVYPALSQSAYTSHHQAVD
ncbi:hypothetical protein QQF64_001525 [Cirrhinus molitorella]|uniref:Uncharacterized protein n=1 Tax=Cirrhinus molitorella TaxID=172907 RepID=A0ABR3P0A8_9TELE